VRFHLIDRVDAWEPRASVRARKLTSHGEEFWEPSAGGPRMPPPFILEALCQAGTWLILLSTDTQRRAALLSVGSVRWHADVHPGDVLELAADVDSWGEERAVISGRVTVEGRLIMEAQEIMCALMNAADLADLDDTARIGRVLTRAEA
jgi:3-hydroxyacyl-[acyl-carrier-protein] dehydratase